MVLTKPKLKGPYSTISSSPPPLPSPRYYYYYYKFPVDPLLLRPNVVVPRVVGGGVGYCRERLLGDPYGGATTGHGQPRTTTTYYLRYLLLTLLTTYTTYYDDYLRRLDYLLGRSERHDFQGPSTARALHSPCNLSLHCIGGGRKETRAKEAPSRATPMGSPGRPLWGRLSSSSVLGCVGWCWVFGLHCFHIVQKRAALFSRRAKTCR